MSERPRYRSCPPAPARAATPPRVVRAPSLQSAGPADRLCAKPHQPLRSGRSALDVPRSCPWDAAGHRRPDPQSSSAASFGLLRACPGVPLPHLLVARLPLGPPCGPLWRCRWACARRRLGGWCRRWLVHRGADGLQLGPLLVKHALERLGELFAQMKPIVDLGGLGRTCWRSAGKGTGPIPTNDRNAGIPLAPFCSVIAAPIRPPVQHPMGFPVHHNRSIRPAFAPGPLVQAPDLRRRWCREAGRTENPQPRARTADDAPFRPEGAAGIAARREGAIAQGLRQAGRPAGRWRHYLRQPLSEELPRADRSATAKAADQELPAHGERGPGPIARMARIATMHALGYQCASVHSYHDLLRYGTMIKRAQ